MGNFLDAALYSLIALSHSPFCSYVTPRFRCSSGLRGSSRTIILGNEQPARVKKQRTRSRETTKQKKPHNVLIFLPFTFHRSQFTLTTLKHVKSSLAESSGS